MAATGWKRPFADPIPLPGGRQLVTDAAGISGYAKPPPRPYLSGICQVDFIAKVRMLYAMHSGVSLIAGQRHPHRFVPLCPWAL